MSNSVAQSCAEPLCRFLRHNLSMQSPVFAALCLYLQKRSRGAFARYVAEFSAAVNIAQAFRQLFEVPLSDVECGVRWNAVLLAGATTGDSAIDAALEQSCPRHMSPDNRRLFVEELTRLRHERIVGEDLVFAFEFFGDAEHRQQEGSFFTDKRNALRMFDPLFVDAHNAAMLEKRDKTTLDILTKRFFDPACGSGSILIEAKRTVQSLVGGGGGGGGMLIDASNFVGVELDVAAATCAELALRVVDDELGVVSAPRGSVRAGNSLALNWADLARRSGGNASPFDFIVGNPPFLGGSHLNRSQRDDMKRCWSHQHTPEMDYVSAWFQKASVYIERVPTCRCAFISTDSITQGAQLNAIWPTLLTRVRIDFAFESVRWHPRMLVNCVIIGLSARTTERCGSVFYRATRRGDDDNAAVFFVPEVLADELAPHLVPGVPYVDIGSRVTNLSPGLPSIWGGCQLQDSSDLDGFAFTLEQFVEQYGGLSQERVSALAAYARPHVTARHLLGGREMYCLDLNRCERSADVPPEFAARVEHVREARARSESADIRKLADAPHRWSTYTLPRPGVLLVMPVTSGKNYCVFPVVRVDPAAYRLSAGAQREVACSATTLYVESESMYHFGVLQSACFRAWVHAFCGTNGDSTRFNTQLYKSFPWPVAPSTAAVDGVTTAARAIDQYRAEARRRTVDERPDEERRRSVVGSMHALYCVGDAPMEPPLAALHAQLDAAVDVAYGMTNAAADDDVTRLAFLCALYRRLTLEERGGVKRRQSTLGEMFGGKEKRVKVTE